MAFTIEFTARAIRDIDEIATYISVDSAVRSTRWRQQLHEKLRRLSTMPTACGLAPEDEFAGREVRQLLFGVYRVLFTVHETQVLIVAVRHGSRRFLTAYELDEAENMDPGDSAAESE